MIPQWRAWPLALGLIATNQFSRAQPAPSAPSASAEPSGPPAPDIDKEMTELIRVDAQAALAAEALNAGTKAKKPVDADVVVLAPYTVNAAKIPVVTINPYETPLAKFLRTGDIRIHVGEKMVIKANATGENAPHGFGRLELKFQLLW